MSRKFRTCVQRRSHFILIGVLKLSSIGGNESTECAKLCKGVWRHAPSEFFKRWYDFMHSRMFLEQISSHFPSILSSDLLLLQVVHIFYLDNYQLLVWHHAASANFIYAACHTNRKYWCGKFRTLVYAHGIDKGNLLSELNSTGFILGCVLLP